jgi:Fic family protein
MQIPPFTITSKILNLIDAISKEIAKIEILNKDIIVPKLRKTNQIKTIAASLQIEGNTLDTQKITAILNGQKVLATFKELEEVNGAIKAYERMDNFNYKNLKDFLKAHKLMMGEVLTNAGAFRGSNVGVVGQDGVSHIAPPPIQVPNLMGNIFDWLGKTEDNLLLVSCITHFEIEFIHPFSDGNGRMGRFWQNLILNSYSEVFKYIPIEELMRKNQQDYYKALEVSDSEGNSDFFNEFMLEIVMQSVKDFKSDQKSNYKSDQKILGLIKQNNKITIDELAKEMHFSVSGVKKVISKLKAQNQLQRVGKKGGYWIILNGGQDD